MQRDGRKRHSRSLACRNDLSLELVAVAAATTPSERCFFNSVHVSTYSWTRCSQDLQCNSRRVARVLTNIPRRRVVLWSHRGCAPFRGEMPALPCEGIALELRAHSPPGRHLERTPHFSASFGPSSSR